MPSVPETFSGEITVASRIVDYLSSGLYESPAACLKELVNNSYDADATLVEIFVKPDANRIIIEDDGVGMNRGEFESHFRRIAESHKRDSSDITDLGRPKIGKIGIGFIAANEICDVMEIFSTKAGNTELLHVEIDFHKMRESTDDRRREGNDLAKGDYRGEVLSADREDHFTRVFLKDVRGNARSILAGAQRPHSDSVRSLYGLSPDSVQAALADPALDSWSDLDYYSETALNVALNVPVAYHDQWIPGRLKPKVKKFSDATAALNFRVFYDGTQLLKPIVLRPGERGAFVRRFSFKGQHVAAEGYFYARHGALKPQELNGLLLRIRNAAVGEYDAGFLDYPSSQGTLFQRWISAEIWADDGLEDALNIDRRTLRVAEPAYAELRDAIHNELSGVIKQAREDLYQAQSRSRKAEKTASHLERLAELSERHEEAIGSRTTDDVTRRWQNAVDDCTLQRRLLQKYDVVEIYDLVLEVAAELLEPEDLERFIERLTTRLTE